MRIRITENQYKVLLENEDYVAKYKKLCGGKILEVDKIYSSVINYSVGEVLGGVFNAEEIINNLARMENAIYSAENHMLELYNHGMISNVPVGFDQEISKIADMVVDKITALSLLLNPLDKLQEYERERMPTQKFKNIKPIPVQSFDSK